MDKIISLEIINRKCVTGFRDENEMKKKSHILF